MNFTVWAKFRHTFDVHYTFFAAEKSFIVWFISHFYLFNIFDSSLWHEDTDQSPSVLTCQRLNICCQLSAEQYSFGNGYVCSSRDASAYQQYFSRTPMNSALFTQENHMTNLWNTVQWIVFVCECVLLWIFRFFHKKIILIFFIDKNGYIEVNEWWWWWFEVLERKI